MAKYNRLNFSSVSDFLAPRSERFRINRGGKPRRQRMSRFQNASLCLESLEDRIVLDGGLSQVFNNVPEANDYSLVYELPIGSVNNFTSSVPYTVDNTASITNDFDRIAYYLGLDSGSGLQWVYASMDAFTTDVTKTGVPMPLPVRFISSLLRT